MSARTVKTQTELDAALADNAVDYINIVSERGVWLSLSCSGSATVRAYGSATVRAYGSATVEAYGSATVHGRYSSTITASSHVAVHLHHATVTVTGGVLIDHVSLNLEDPEAWCAYHGLTVTDGTVTVYKAVGDDYTTGGSFTGTSYAPGTTPVAPDWRPNNDCGRGLHFSPTPRQARYYHPDSTRFLACQVAVADLRPILGSTAKCKAPRVLEPGCVEVDIDCNPLAVAS